MRARTVAREREDGFTGGDDDLGFGEQFADVDAEGAREARGIRDGGVLFAALDLRQGGAGDPGAGGELVEREVAVPPAGPHPRAEHPRSRVL